MQRAIFTLLFIVTTNLSAAELTVHIEGIRTTEGHLLLSVSGSPEAWDGQAPPAAVQRVPDMDETAKIVFPDLAPGRYAVAVIHDANDNGELDTNLVGMPIESYGFSNNPRVMRKATFEEAVFDLPEDGAIITIELN